MRIDAILHVAEQKLAAKFGTHIETGGGTMVQTDWVQNDETAADYLKNRPGGYYGDPVTVDEEIYSGEINDVRMGIDTDAGVTLVIGQAYKVTIGDAEKTYTAFADSFSGIDCVTIGDGKIAEVLESSEMFGLVYTAIEGEGSEAMAVCPVADVGKTIRVTTETQKREVHKIPTELLDLGGVDESINQTNAALDALRDQHVSDIFSINKMLTEGPITFVGPGKTSSLILGKFADMGFQIRWEVSDGSYCYMNRQGFVVNNKTHGTNISVSGSNISVVEQTKKSGIRFTLEHGDLNGGTRFSVGNVAGDLTTFYASGKIINSNKLLQLSANDTITEDNATTLRGVKTPEQEYDAANKKYVDQRLTSPTTAQVGQIVKVKAVDESGKITETEAVDMPTVSDDYELVFQETVAEDAYMYSRDTDKDGNPFSLTDVMVIIFTKPFAESTNSAGRGLGFLPTSKWGKDLVSCDIGSSISSANTNSVGRYNVVFVKVVNGYQVVTRAYKSQNESNVFGVLMRQTTAGNEMFRFHTDATKLMQLDTPQGNITCVKIVGYINPSVSAGTIVALYKKKGT